jgi:hypothetical protein
MSSTLVLDAPSMTPRCPSMSTGWPAVGPRPQAPRGADEREGEDEQTTHICSERFKHDVACGIARLGGRSARWKRRGTQGRGRHLSVDDVDGELAAALHAQCVEVGLGLDQMPRVSLQLDSRVRTSNRVHAFRGEDGRKSSIVPPSVDAPKLLPPRSRGGPIDGLHLGLHTLCNRPATSEGRQRERERFAPEHENHPQIDAREPPPRVWPTTKGEKNFHVIGTSHVCPRPPPAERKHGCPPWGCDQLTRASPQLPQAQPPHRARAVQSPSQSLSPRSIQRFAGGGSSLVPLRTSASNCSGASKSARAFSASWRRTSTSSVACACM